VDTGPADTTPSTTTSTTTVEVSEVSHLAGDGGVLLVGDSLMAGVRHPLGDVLEEHGIDWRFVGGEGTGLLSDGSWWLDDIEAEVEDFDPSVVVIEACCNVGGTGVEEDSVEMYDEWQQAAETAVELAGSRGAAVYWVLTPSASPESGYADVARRIERFNAIYRDLGVPLIDWAALLEPEGEGYVDELDFGSTTLQVRSGDGLHLTPAGSTLAALATWATIAEVLR
jgi:hypothetical protein